MGTRLPGLVVWLVRLVTPSRRVDTVLADLEHDYTAARPRRTRWWLAGETISLVAAYASAHLHDMRRNVPIWIRDGQLVVRGLRRGTVAMMAATALLAVGLAAVLLTDGLVQALLLRPVSASYGDALRRIVAMDRQGRVVTRFSFTELQFIRERISTAGEIGAVYLQPVVARASGTDVQTMAEIVDGQYFALTGMTTVMGRGLMSGDDRHESPPVAVLAAPFWRRYFDASSSVLGATVRLNGAAYTVVGVADVIGSSSFLGASVDAWVPIAHADPLLNAGWRGNVRDRWFTPFVLPRDGLAEVDHRLTGAAGDLAQVHADPWRERRLQTADATVLVGSQRSSALMLAAVIGGLAALILIAAASNVSGVLLARAASTQRAAAIHMSLGAGRSVVVRRQLLEGAMMGAVAGAFAIALYVWARVQLAEIAVLPTLALRLALPLTAQQIILAVIAGTVCGLLLALGPAMWATRLDLIQGLRDSDGRSGDSARVTTMRRVLVSSQVCISLVLIVAATLFLRSLDALLTTNLGFSRDRLVAMDFDVEPQGQMPGDLTALARHALTRVENMPGVSSAAMSNRAPIDQSTPIIEVQLPGRDASSISDVTMYLATERYFDTVGVGMAAGRAFTTAEVSTAADVAIVNESLAARLWPGAAAVDRALYLPGEGKTLRIIGVARDSKYRTLTESARPHVYRPAAPTLGLTLLARTRGDPRETLRAIQGELDRVGPGVVGFFPRTLDDHLAVQLLPTRAAARAATLLGAIALLLSALALYALVAWFVVLRRREIGVRMALGASTRDVRRLVVRQAFAAAAPGVVAGTALAIGLGVVAQSALYGVSAVDPTALVVGVGALALVVLIAGYVPSRAATRVDPVQALRQ